MTLVSGTTTSVATGTVQFGGLTAAGIHLGLMAWGGIGLGVLALSLGLAAIWVRRHPRSRREREPEPAERAVVPALRPVILPADQ